MIEANSRAEVPEAEDCSSGDGDAFQSLNDFTSCIDDAISNARIAALDMGVPAPANRASRIHAIR